MRCWSRASPAARSRPARNSSMAISRAPKPPCTETVASSASNATARSPNGEGACKLPPTVPMLRTAGPPIERAAACRKASSRSAQNLRERHAGADRDAPAGGADLAQAAVLDPHYGRERNVALVEGAHHERAAAEIARAAIRRERRRRLADGREGFHADRHEAAPVRDIRRRQTRVILANARIQGVTPPSGLAASRRSREVPRLAPARRCPTAGSPLLRG